MVLNCRIGHCYAEEKHTSLGNCNTQCKESTGHEANKGRHSKSRTFNE